ncbi:MAG TPA: hypothetical protein ENH33_10125, partial [Actinobacteria bacterium]|nr:hypothetical protein [Actinomycetota bacterium]
MPRERGPRDAPRKVFVESHRHGSLDEPAKDRSGESNAEHTANAEVFDRRQREVRDQAVGGPRDQIPAHTVVGSPSRPEERLRVHDRDGAERPDCHCSSEETGSVHERRLYGTRAPESPSAHNARRVHVKRPIVLCCGNLALTELPSTTTNLRHRMDARTTADWHAISVTEAVARLDTNERDGLGHAEAGARLEQHGANRIREVPAARRYQVLARQFTDVLIIILLIAAAVSFAVGEIADAVTILVIVVLNGALGFVQEWKAEQALEALRSMLSPTCSVTRAGQPMEIDRIDLVPGDLVTLEIGDQVPADLRLVESLNLKVDESALTGESGSVHKDTGPVPGDTQLAERTPMVWMGTNVTNGRALGVVVATGMATVFGKIAELTQSLGQEPTPLQRKLAVLGKQLGVIS